MLLGLCDWGVGASRVTLAIALALLRCTAVLLLLLFPKRGQERREDPIVFIVFFSQVTSPLTNSFSPLSDRAAVFGGCHPTPRKLACQFQSTLPNTNHLLLHAHGPNFDALFLPSLACDGFPEKIESSRLGALRCNVPHRVVTPAVNTTPKGLPNLRKPGPFFSRTCFCASRKSEASSRSRTAGKSLKRTG